MILLWVLSIFIFFQESWAIASDADGLIVVQNLSTFNKKEANCSSSAEKMVLPGSEICDNRLKYLEDRVKNQMNLQDLAKTLRAQNTQILILGEAHFGAAQRALQEILKTFKKEIPDIDCLFVEFPQEYKSAIESILNGRASPAWAVGIEPYASVLKEARSSNIRIVPVDDSFTVNDKTRATTTEGMNTRDKTISKNILSELKAKSCAKGVLIIGKSHVSDFLRQNRETTADRLRKNEIRISTVNLQDSGPDNLGDSKNAWNWEECSKNPPKSDKIFSFKNTPAPSGVTFDSRGGKWTDYSFTIVLPYDPQYTVAQGKLVAPAAPLISNPAPPKKK